MATRRSRQWRHWASNRSRACGLDASMKVATSQQATTPRSSRPRVGLTQGCCHQETTGLAASAFKTLCHRSESPLNKRPLISTKTAFFRNQKLQTLVGKPPANPLASPASNWGSSPEFENVFVFPLPSGPTNRYSGRVERGDAPGSLTYSTRFPSLAFASAIKALMAASSSETGGGSGFTLLGFKAALLRKTRIQFQTFETINMLRRPIRATAVQRRPNCSTFGPEYR